MTVGRHSSKSSGVSSRGSDMRTVSFHIYKGEEVVSHNLSVDQLEKFLVDHHGNIGVFDIVALEDPEYDEASF